MLGFYVASSESVRSLSGLGVSPTDTELTRVTGWYRPVHTGWIEATPLGGVGDAETSMLSLETMQRRTMVFQALSALGVLALATVAVVGALRGK